MSQKVLYIYKSWTIVHLDVYIDQKKKKKKNVLKSTSSWQTQQSIDFWRHF